MHRFRQVSPATWESLTDPLSKVGCRCRVGRRPAARVVAAQLTAVRLTWVEGVVALSTTVSFVSTTDQVFFTKNEYRTFCPLAATLTRTHHAENLQDSSAADSLVARRSFIEEALA